MSAALPFELIGGGEEAAGNFTREIEIEGGASESSSVLPLIPSKGVERQDSSGFAIRAVYRNRGECLPYEDSSSRGSVPLSISAASIASMARA